MTTGTELLGLTEYAALTAPADEYLTERVRGAVVREGALLTGENVLGGLVAPLAEVFRQRTGAGLP